MEPITETLATVRKSYEVAKTIQKVYNVSKEMKPVAESEGKEQIMAIKDPAHTTADMKHYVKRETEDSSSKDFKFKNDMHRGEGNDSPISKDVFIDKIETTHVESEQTSDTTEFVDKIYPTNPLNKLEYEQGTFINRLSSSESSTTPRTELFGERIEPSENNSTTLTSRLTETNPMVYNKITETTTKKEPENIENKEKEIKETNYKEITEDELKELSPDLYNYIQEMHHRLDNDCEDGIMNTLHFYKGEDGSILVNSDDPQYTNSSIKVKGNEVYCNSGGRNTDGHLNEFLNESRMMPDKTYHIDNDIYLYHTDKKGRVTQISEDYTKGDINDRLCKRGNLKPISDSKDGLQNDVGGHIVANNRAGMTEAINIVPMDSVFNNAGAWKSMESELCNAKENGTLQKVETNLKYDDSMRPTEITVKATIDGIEKTYKYTNI